MRSSIAESQPGRPLSLEITVVEEGSCAPRPDVLVSLFHANADGIYSGFAEQGLERAIDTTDQTWLRGGQITDARGRVSFETIYPGWYTGRVTHVHLTAESNGKLLLTTQIYFPDDVMRAVYAESSYRGWRDTEDSGDSVRLKVGRGELPRFAIEQSAAGDHGTVRLAFKG